jgi:hypothetical protein
MFGNKKKIDSKIRFQNSRFKNRLSRARGYKRQIRTRPAGRGGIFLSKIGLDSWFSRFATLLVFLFLIWLVFIPNIFFVKQIIINTSQSGDRPVIQALTDAYLSKKLPWPQKNLILLSKSGLSNFLQKNDEKILKVSGINKKFPSTLIVSITPRIDQFLIQTASSTYFSVANDGLDTAEVFPDASGTLPSNLTLVKLDNSDGLIIGRQAFSQSQVDFLNQLQQQLPGIVKSPINYYELDSLNTPDLTVYFKGGFKIMVSLNADTAATLNHLSLLFSQFAAADIQKLDYIDMRFGDNGYVCDKGLPCVQNLNLPNNNAPVN